MVGIKDRKLMQLAHYFITVKNYTPMLVKGVQNEIWLENLQEPYKIIRINANYIHNKEQYNYDLFKIKNIVKQVKRKTLSFNVSTLNILLNIGSSVELYNTKNIFSLSIGEEENVINNSILNELYSDFKERVVEEHDSMEFLLDVSKDINEKAENENKIVEKIFKQKKKIITYAIIAINILIFLLGNLGQQTGKFEIFSKLILSSRHVEIGQIHRLITAAFTHADILHLAMNMYALYIIGGQIETFLGKTKYIIIYLASAISASLLSCVVYRGFSLGASGAIFGLMGALLYFGYHYRLYLDGVLRTQIIPLILINITTGFLFPNIDNAAHIGGLVGGLFISMALGIPSHKKEKLDIFNGLVCYFALIGTLSFLIFGR